MEEGGKKGRMERGQEEATERREKREERRLSLGWIIDNYDYRFDEIEVFLCFYQPLILLFF